MQMNLFISSPPNVIVVPVAIILSYRQLKVIDSFCDVLPALVVLHQIFIYLFYVQPSPVAGTVPRGVHAVKNDYNCSLYIKTPSVLL